MGFFIISVILLSISIILFIKIKNKVINNKEIEKEEERLKRQLEWVKNERDKISTEIEGLQRELKDTNSYLEICNKTMQKQKDTLDDSLSQYSDLLDNTYNQNEEEYDDALELLKNSYNKEQDKLIAEIDNVKKDLDKIRATRAAAQEALLKEQEIKEDMSFYSLNPSKEDIDDIQTLERIKPKLHQPRILCMLIWSTYFQKPMTQLCNNIVGLNEVCGIYKITNQLTNQCYIGQSVDIAKRWKDHVKCGLGIDTPANNKLYQSMTEYEIWNFTFEILEKCNKEQLNEKEAFYISLYQANEFGFNSNTGIKK